MFCPKCGTEAKGGSEFCGKCGAKLTQPISKRKKGFSLPKLFIPILLGVLLIVAAVVFVPKVFPKNDG